MNAEYMGYTIQKGEAKTSNFSIGGEYHLFGKRGAHYVTWRWNRNGKTDQMFQFMNANTGVFVKIHGNAYLPVENFEALFAGEVAA